MGYEKRLGFVKIIFHCFEKLLFFNRKFPSPPVKMKRSVSGFRFILKAKVKNGNCKWSENRGYPNILGFQKHGLFELETNYYNDQADMKYFRD